MKTFKGDFVWTVKRSCVENASSDNIVLEEIGNNDQSSPSSFTLPKLNLRHFDGNST